MERQRKRSKNTWGKCAKEVKFTKKARKGEGRTQNRTKSFELNTA